MVKMLNEASSKIFMSLLKEIINTNNREDATSVLYSENGVDISYQRNQITWEQHEVLFDLVNRIYGKL